MEPLLARAVAFETWVKSRWSTEVIALGWGRAFLNDDVGMSHEHNHIVVEAFDPPPTVDDAIRAADRVLGARGLHRRIDVPHPDHGARLEPGFVARGWLASSFVWMAAVRAPERRDGVEAVEVSWEELRPFEEALVRTGPWATDEETVRHLTDRSALAIDAARARFFAVRAGGEIVSSCHLYSDGRTAQIENVQTADAHQRKGYARAVCSRALAEARGHDLVTLVTEPDGVARGLYTSLGFDPIGITYSFDEPM